MRIHLRYGLGLFLVISSAANATSFALNDQAVTYLGNAYAGTASAAQDASTAYYNPAGLSELKRSQIALGITHIDQNIQLHNAFAKNSINGVISGNDPSKPKASLIVPTGHFALRTFDDLSFGFSIVEPFHLYTEYSSTDIARLMATKNEIKAIDLSPSIGYRINPFISIGAALDFLRIKTDIASEVAWGNTGSEARGYVINTANTWAKGYHLGILLHPRCDTQVGLVYFSKFNASLTGDTLSFQTVDFDNATRVNYVLHLPEHVNFGATYHIDRKWTAMGEVEWMHWNRLRNITLNYNSSARPGIKTFNFKNTVRVSVGTDYKLNRGLTLKGGFAYQQSPTNDRYRSAMFPDSNHYLLGLGVKFSLNKWASVIAAYSRAFYTGANIAETGLIDALNPIPNVTNQSVLNASIKNSANKFGLQLNVSFM